MSYLQRWRKYNAEVQVIAQISSSESEHEKSDDLASSNEVEPVYQQDSSDAEFNNDINIHDVGEIEGYHSDSSSAIFQMNIVMQRNLLQMMFFLASNWQSVLQSISVHVLLLMTCWLL